MSVRRTILILIVSILLVVSLSACATPFNSTPTIVGTWRGEYLGSTVLMSFNEDGTINIYLYGGFQNGTYTINTDVAPHQLDLTFPDAETIHTIVELVDADTLKMENVYPGVERPSAFSDFVILERTDNEPPQQ